MIRFFKKITFCSVGAMVSALVLFFSACTEVDDQLGVNIVAPSDERMEVRFATFDSGITTYQTYTDSIVCSSFDYAYMGKLRNEGLGVTTAAALVQFGGGSRSDTVKYEDRTSVPDSMLIICDLKYLGGDTLVEQTFNVYPLAERLMSDSTYYNNYDYRAALKNWGQTGSAQVEPMFTFTYSGKPNSGDYYDTLRLKKGYRAEEFMRALMATDEELCENDSLFVNAFNGFCIVPAETSAEAAIYGLNLQYDSTYGPESFLVLYGHDYLTADSQQGVVDNIVRAYPITNSSYFGDLKAMSRFDHSYDEASGVEQSVNENVAADEPLRNPCAESWVQGTLGVTTTLEFGKEFLDELRALQVDGKKVFINQAMLYVELADKDYLLYDYAPTRLGSYLNYAAVEPVADYNYYYESSYDMTLNYGGMFDRTHGRYTMDLSIYMQQLLQEAEGVAPRVTLGMTAYEYINDAAVKLAGSSSDAPIKMDITYTLLCD